MTKDNQMPFEIVVSKSGRWIEQTMPSQPNMIDTFSYVSRRLYDKQADTIEAKDMALDMALEALKKTRTYFLTASCNDMVDKAIAQIEAVKNV